MQLLLALAFINKLVLDFFVPFIKIREKTLKTGHSSEHLPHMGDNKCRGRDEKIIHTVKLLSNWLRVDGVVWYVPTGQGYHLNAIHQV